VSLVPLVSGRVVSLASGRVVFLVSGCVGRRSVRILMIVEEQVIAADVAA
jgi:hypothetical protein